MSSNERNFNSYIFDDKDNNELYNNSTLNNILIELKTTDDIVLDKQEEIDTGNISFIDLKTLTDDGYSSTNSLFGDIELSNIISNIEDDENNTNSSDEPYDNTDIPDKTEVVLDNEIKENIEINNDNIVIDNTSYDNIDFNNNYTDISSEQDIYSNVLDNIINFETNYKTDNNTELNNNINTNSPSNEVNIVEKNIIDSSNIDNLNDTNNYDSIYNSITNIGVSNLNYNVDSNIETNSSNNYTNDNVEKYTASNNNISNMLPSDNINIEEKNVNDSSNNSNLDNVNDYNNTYTPITNIDVSSLEDNNISNIEIDNSNNYTDTIESHIETNSNINTDISSNEVNTVKENTIIDSSNSDNSDDEIIDNKINIAQIVEQTEDENKTYEMFDNDELLVHFIGKNNDKIINRPFNFSAFFFTSFYLFYRKLYLYGILLFILNLLALFFLNSIMVTLVFGLLCGFLFNIVYLKTSKRKISNIKSKNSNKDIEQIEKICMSKGGTSIGNIFIGFITEITVVILSIVIMSITGLIPSIDNLISYISNRANILIKNNDYNGIITYDTSIKIKDKFYISIPSNFENNSNTYEYNFNYKSNDGTFDNCNVSLSVPDGYSSSDKLIENMAKYYTGNSDVVKEITTNGLVWHWFSYDGTFGKTFYYATTLDKKVYLFEYTIEEDSPSDCDIYRLQILNSIIKK